MDTREIADKPRTKVSFCIRAAGLEPDWVTQFLGLIPDRVHRKGDYPRDNPKYSPYKAGLWSIDSKIPEDAPFAAHIEALLLILEPLKPEMLELRRSCKIEFYCGLFDYVGFGLTDNLLKRIGELGVSLEVSIYRINDGNPDTATDS